MRSTRHVDVRRPGVVVAGVMAAVVLLGACTSAADPSDPSPARAASTAATTVSGSITTTPSTTAATALPTTGTAGSVPYPTGVPAAARANTTEGAQEFVKFYFGLVNEAYTSPKAGLLPPLSSATCKSCAAFERIASGFVAKGQRYDQPMVSVLEVSPSWQDKPERRVIDATVRQNPAHVVNASGQVTETIPQADAVFVVTLSRSGPGWAVELIQVLG